MIIISENTVRIRKNEIFIESLEVLNRKSKYLILNKEFVRLLAEIKPIRISCSLLMRQKIINKPV